MPRQRKTTHFASKPDNNMKRASNKQKHKIEALTAHEIEERINKMEDIYLNLDIVQCVNEIENIFGKQKKKTALLESYYQSVDKESSEDILEEALIWLKQDQNLCFYGFGNKEPLVDEFVHKHFGDDHLIITIRGYQRDLTHRSLLMQILQVFETDQIELLKFNNKNTPFQPYEVVQKCIYNMKTSKKADIEKLVGYLASLLNVVKTPIIFVVHNLDNPNLRYENFLDFFSKLAIMEPHIFTNTKARINFVATVDSIKAYYYLNTKIVDNFSFMYFELASNKIYDKQFDYMSVVDILQTGRKYIQNVKSVIDSLTENQQELVFFTLQVFYKLDKKVIDENELFKKAVEDAKVSSLYQFKDNIREAVQHHIFRTKHIYNQFCYTTKLTNSEILGILEYYDMRECVDEPSLLNQSYDSD